MNDARTHFDHLRTTPWEPTFTWLDSVQAAADRINCWHEDYPQRVEVTASAIGGTNPPMTSALWEMSPNDALKALHGWMFWDTDFAARWRRLNVTVGPHRPPNWQYIPRLMQQLGDWYPEHFDLDLLQAWYTDFNTIHPFTDGNGRTSGVVVAALSHELHPERGYWAADQ